MKRILCYFITVFYLLNIGLFNGYAKQKPDGLLSNIDNRFFIENKGQWPEEVLYLTRMGGMDVWITKQGVNYTFYRVEKNLNASMRENEDFLNGKFDHHPEDNMLLGHRVITEYVGANTNPTREGRQKQEGYYNYLIGNDPGKHASFVGLYKEALVKEVYNGIDIRYYFDRGCLRYDYVVHPGADPTQITFRICGQNSAYLKEKNLVFTTRFGEVQLSDLYTYQGRKPIKSHFVKNGDKWQISVGNYDKTQTLIIDPLVYSTYLGGSIGEEGRGIAVDGSGCAFVTGYTNSIDYDVTVGPFQTTHGGGNLDVFVTKLAATGNSLVYSTYIGGNSLDAGFAIALDGNGNVFVTGRTWSTDYDVTPGAFQTNYGGGNSDVFVTKLNPSGSSLMYSTYIGGSGEDRCLGISLDNNGNVYVTGLSFSTDFPVTAGAFQTTHGGGNSDVFVTKLNFTGSGLVYSTYIGGSGDDLSRGIVIDGIGNAYLTGRTNSTDYNITPGAFQTTYGGGYSDVFVTKLNPTGSSLVYSTYIGGSGQDEGLGIAIDDSGHSYITGETWSGDYDITTGAFQMTLDGLSDVFVTKLNPTGSNLVYSTYLGGSGKESGYSICLDGSGNACLTGETSSSNFAVSNGAFQIDYGGGNSDVFVSKLNSTGGSLMYSTYIGGSNSDIGNSIAVNSSGNVYVTGGTYSTDFDVTTGAFQTTNGGTQDVFVAKIDLYGISGITDFLSKTIHFSIFPNPNNGQFSILSEKGGEFELLDIKGSMLFIYRFDKTELIVREKLSIGVYFLHHKESGQCLRPLFFG
ncbi:MAG: SBBP repeat-containing protein [Flavobacteriales bacterium]|nr:SBBP repeat-containing protein [Flavobacteriales bacterium]